MKADMRRALLACLVVATAAVVLVATGSAKPRDPAGVVATFDAFPGPGEVTYGEDIAYRATLDNKSGTTLTHVIFRQQFPEITRGDPLVTTPLPLPNPVDSSCAAWGGTAGTRSITVEGVSKTEWYCDLGQRPANAKVTLTVVWNVPVPETAGQAGVNCDDCLSSRGYWTVKEGLNDGTQPNDTFGEKTAYADLLAQSGSGEKLKAGGYETASVSCGEGDDIDTEADGNLRTTPLGAGNFLTTTICLPTIDLENAEKQLGLGYAAKITEASNSRSATVCIAALGVSCDVANPVEANFGAEDVVHIFHIALDGVGKNFEITTSDTGLTSVKHDDEFLRLCKIEGAESDLAGCVVTIVPPKGNDKFWIVVAKSPTNGLWGW